LFGYRRVGGSLCGKRGDASFLRCQSEPRFNRSLRHGLSGGTQFRCGAIGETQHFELKEHFMGNAKLMASVSTPTLPTKPLAVKQVGTR
jgi:hypothetical protein